MSRPYVRGLEAERFWPKVAKSDGCWLWTAATNQHGYGIFRLDNGTNRRAHRWSWEQVNGPVPDGLVLDHICHDQTCTEGGACSHRRCVRPGHMVATTRAANSRRSVPGGRSWRKSIAACPAGHAYDEANTYVYDGRRHCRKCRNARSNR